MRELSKWLVRASGTSHAVVIAAAVAAGGVFALIPLIAKPRVAPREIVLVARDMAFYLDGSHVPNPTLMVKKGEEVRLILRNQEPGVTHDLAIATLEASIEPIRGGSTGSVWLRAPEQVGRHEYLCRPHSQMMRGGLLVAE